MNIWTVGHSTRTLDVFKEILVANGIEVLVDVRTYPGSRRYPQFNKPELAQFLESIGIKYEHEPRLGGRRTPRKDSHNTAWRNPQFRGYADHMETEEFEQGIKALLELADRSRTTVMCAEAVWWRCHRSLIADYLKAQGHTVVHIMDVNKTEEHPFTAAASIVEGKLSYRGLF
jgi:uncharacterized protein (DUF488 family)